jgi:hypothetical protein
VSVVKFPCVFVKLDKFDVNYNDIAIKVCRATTLAGVSNADVNAYRDACSSNRTNHRKMLEINLSTVILE